MRLARYSIPFLIALHLFSFLFYISDNKVEILKELYLYTLLSLFSHYKQGSVSITSLLFALYTYINIPAASKNSATSVWFIWMYLLATLTKPEFSIIQQAKQSSHLQFAQFYLPSVRFPDYA